VGIVRGVGIVTTEQIWKLILGGRLPTLDELDQ
jgi:hypothetical protein